MLTQYPLMDAAPGTCQHQALDKCWSWAQGPAALSLPLGTVPLQQPRGHCPCVEKNPLSWGLQPSKPYREEDVPKQALGTAKVTASRCESWPCKDGSSPSATHPGCADLTRTETVRLPPCFRCHRSWLCHAGTVPAKGSAGGLPACEFATDRGSWAQATSQLMLFWGAVRDHG